jgi:hypothetical protein
MPDTFSHPSQCGDVVVFDKLHAHKGAGVREAIVERRSQTSRLSKAQNASVADWLGFHGAPDSGSGRDVGTSGLRYDISLARSFQQRRSWENFSYGSNDYASAVHTAGMAVKLKRASSSQRL